MSRSRRLIPIELATYGNYCGPNWSDGVEQPSVVGSMPAIDVFDDSCRVHDAAYATGQDLIDADFTFARTNFGKGWIESAAALGVGAQGTLRAIDKYLPKFITQENMSKNPRLRGTPRVPSQQNKQQKISKNSSPSARGVAMNISTSRPPTAIGTTIRSTAPIVQRTVDSARMVGKDFVGTVEANGTTTFGLGKSALLSPAYFSSTVLGNLARSFEKYRWNRLKVHFIPKVATTLAGQLVLSSSHSVAEPNLQPESATFLPRAMSQGNAVFSPLWTPSAIDISCDGSWRLVDPAINADVDDSVYEELQVYTQAATAGQVGYLVAEYDISFSEPIYQPHSTAMPLPTGPGLRVTLADRAAINANLDAVLLTTTGFTPNTNGTIMRAVFDLQGSTAPTGITFTTGFQFSNMSHATTTTFATSNTTYPLVGGTTVYLNVSGSGCAVYNSLEAAILGNGSGQLFYTGATTVIGTYLFDIACVRFPMISMPTTQ